MPDFLSFINEILWGSVMIYLLLGAGGDSAAAWHLPLGTLRLAEVATAAWPDKFSGGA